MIDLMTSRRGMYSICEYWSQYERSKVYGETESEKQIVGNLYKEYNIQSDVVTIKTQNEGGFVSHDELVYKRFPTGKFRAKEVNTISIGSQITDSFMTEETTLVLQTNDNISNLNRNDIVKYDDKIYRVENVQKEPIKKQKQYKRKNVSCSYYISLKG